MRIVDGSPIPLALLAEWAQGGGGFVLSAEARSRMESSRAVVNLALEQGEVIYGINTGFGLLSDVRIPEDQLAQLQLNLVRSHACGFGPVMGEVEVRAMMILRANVLAVGASGARPEAAEKILEFLNAGLTPPVPRRGSVGASGDLAPLAHLALGLIGESIPLGTVEPLRLEAKEGLALLNGTQAIGAVGGLALQRALRLVRAANAACAMSLEGLMGTPTAFDPRIHQLRRAPAQIRVAEELLHWLGESEIRESHRDNDPRVQDAYCLRCAPQVHGAVLEVLESAATAFERETAAATDNPLVFADGDVLSGGNFHAAPLAVWLDAAAVAVTTLMSISERRFDRLVNPSANEGLPAFLAPNAGLESGLMMLHVSVAAALNEAKVLAHPASCDNVPTSGGKEDHVSMGMTAANKFAEVVHLAEFVISAELFAASAAIDYRRPLRTSEPLEGLHAKIREIAPAITGDRPFGRDAEALASQLSVLL